MIRGLSIRKTKVLMALGAAIIVFVVMAAYDVNVAYAQQSYPTYTLESAWPSWGGVPIPPPWPAPWWNPFSPTTLLYYAATNLPLAVFNDASGTWWPILAENWTIIPENHTLILHLRKGLYWFNGTAIMPFTAWDVYAWFYIGDKAFGDWEPWLMPQNADKDIIVINNYTLSIHFDYWAPFAWYWLASQSITTPWPVWEKVVKELKTMNASQAWTFGHTNITEMVVPYWALSPYYVTYVSPSTIVIQLEPMYFDGRPLLAAWDKIFPVHTWQYYPKIIDYYTLTSYTSAVALALKDKDVWLPSWDPTPNYVSTLMSAGEYTVTLPDIANFGVTFPWYYPYNIPQVRQAFLYIINRTEAALAWTTLNYTVPIYINIPTPAPNAESGFWLTFPEDIRAMGINFTQPNWTKAAQLLESAGLYYKNGQWYLPNGTPLTLTFYITGTGWWPTVTQAVALQLSQFGIKTRVVSLEASTYDSLEVSCGLPAYGDWAYAGAKGGYLSQWSTYSGIQWISLDLYAGGRFICGRVVCTRPYNPVRVPKYC